MDNRLKKGLGRGLSSLLGDTHKKVETNKVSIKDLSRNKFYTWKYLSIALCVIFMFITFYIIKYYDP